MHGGFCYCFFLFLLREGDGVVWCGVFSFRLGDAWHGMVFVVWWSGVEVGTRNIEMFTVFFLVRLCDCVVEPGLLFSVVVM